MQHTDQELLELAAKAIGIKLMWSQDVTLHPRRADDWTIWNPLAEDGDALRLACALGLKVDANFKTSPSDNVGVGVWTPDDKEFYPPFWTAPANDICKATRQTIVRAAAHMGKAMP